MPAGAPNVEIILIGLNHKTAPVEVRERLSFSGDKNQPFGLIREVSCVKEFMFLSTCNRVEVLLTSNDGGAAEREIKELFGRANEIPLTAFEAFLYVYRNEEAVKHLFRVASSLDSMVVGEPQILGQIKNAYFLSTKEKSSGVILNKLLHKTFSVAKKIRSETGIASHAVSISFAAVELARKIFADLDGKKAMLIGAGEMAELASEHLLSNGVSEVLVANRTLERAVDLARRFNGKAISLEEVYDQLAKVDIIISSTGAPGFVIHYENVKKVMRIRRNKPLFLIDIAVPRDIEPRTNDIDNVYLYNIDDLKGVVELNKAERQKEAVQAERIIDEEVISFRNWLKTLDITPVIISLYEKAEALRIREVQKTLSNMGELTPEQEKAIHVLTNSIVKKMLHDPIIYLKRKSKRENRDIYLDFARRFFNLNGSEHIQDAESVDVKIEEALRGSVETVDFEDLDQCPPEKREGGKYGAGN